MHYAGAMNWLFAMHVSLFHLNKGEDKNCYCRRRISTLKEKED